MTNILRNLTNWLEDRTLNPQDMAEGEELVFEIEERRRKIHEEYTAVNDFLSQLIQPSDDPAALARGAKRHAVELEKAIRQAAILLLEMSERLQPYDNGDN